MSKSVCVTRGPQRPADRELPGARVTRGKRFRASGPCSPSVRVALLVAGHGDDDATGHGTVEDEFRRTPTWRAKCRISGSGRPLRFEHWGARGDFASYYLHPYASLRSKLWKEQHKRHRVYTGSGHRCGVIPYSSVWCGGLPLGLMMMNNTRKNSLARVYSCLGR